MTREEAIKVVRNIYQTDAEKKALETLIPELRESEDERIRKELKEAFEAYDIESTWNGIPIRSIFSWLEKLAKSERVIKEARRVLNNWLDDTGCSDVSGDFTELEYAIRKYDGEEKQKESLHIQETCKENADSFTEDERIRKFLIQHISEWIGCIEHDLKNSSKDIESEKELAMFKAGLAYLEKQKYDRMQPVYDNLDSFESALAKAWKAYNDSGSRTVDGCEDDYVECAHAKGFREGYLFGLEKQKERKGNDLHRH